MSVHRRDSQHYGLPPVYETTPYRAPWLLRAAAYAALMLAIVLVFGLAIGALGKAKGSPWICWVGETGTTQCAPQAPDWMLGGET